MFKRKITILFLLVLFFSAPLVYAFDFTVSTTGKPDVIPYIGDTVDLDGAVTPSVTGGCELICKWSTSNMGEHDICDGCGILDGQEKGFGYQTIASGSSGRKYFTLTISCKRSAEGLFCAESSFTSKPYPLDFNFNYAGDGICTTSKEKCADYSSYAGTSDCVCSSSKECRPDSERGSDDNGCATYCGNGIAEKDYETCNGCPSDVGKCDDMQCIENSECEGNYCVHEKCWNKPFREGDGYCDINKGENCKNSVSDCSCEGYERCSASAVCETYCGNDVCEPSEVGTCEADCQWCGDGACEADKGEDCSTCETDCGVCESKELSEKTQQEIEGGLKEASQRQKIIIYSALGIIVVFLVSYFIFKVLMSKKTQTNVVKTVDKKIKKPIEKKLKPTTKKRSKKKASKKK